MQWAQIRFGSLHLLHVGPQFSQWFLKTTTESFKDRRLSRYILSIDTVKEQSKRERERMVVIVINCQLLMTPVCAPSYVTFWDLLIIPAAAHWIPHCLSQAAPQIPKYKKKEKKPNLFCFWQLLQSSTSVIPPRSKTLFLPGSVFIILAVCRAIIRENHSFL